MAGREWREGLPSREFILPNSYFILRGGAREWIWGGARLLQHDCGIAWPLGTVIRGWEKRTGEARCLRKEERGGGEEGGGGGWRG